MASRGYRTFGTTRELGARPAPKSVEMIKLDVRSDESVHAAIDGLLAVAGHIDVMVNNAGFGLTGAIEETSLEEARGQLETNFWGPVRLIKRVLPLMRERRSGRIINVSSVLGFMPAPCQGFYVVSKHALEGYSEVLDLEVRPLGVRVLLVEPSSIRSMFFEHHEEAKVRLEAYKPERNRVTNALGERLHNGTAPEVVAKIIFKAARAWYPAMRYTAGQGSGALKVARALVPTSLFDKSVRLALGTR
jgi:NAD(P)-dependent dehydrogenase (short-subunit alcohol dehydrogenase family)